MDLVAGAGGIFGQLAVGLAGGLAPEVTTHLMPGGQVGGGGGSFRYFFLIIKYSVK